MPFIEINRLESLSRLLHRSIRILLLLLAPKWLWYRRAPCSSDVVRRLRPHMANHCNKSPGLDERIHCGMAENYPVVITVLLDAVQAHARYRSPREQSSICAPYGQLDLPAAIFGNRGNRDVSGWKGMGIELRPAIEGDLDTLARMVRAYYAHGGLDYEDLPARHA